MVKNLVRRSGPPGKSKKKVYTPPDKSAGKMNRLEQAWQRARKVKPQSTSKKEVIAREASMEASQSPPTMVSKWVPHIASLEIEHQSEDEISVDELESPPASPQRANELPWHGFVPEPKSTIQDSAVQSKGAQNDRPLIHSTEAGKQMVNAEITSTPKDKDAIESQLASAKKLVLGQSSDSSSSSDSSTDPSSTSSSESSEISSDSSDSSSSESSSESSPESSSESAQLEDDYSNDDEPVIKSRVQQRRLGSIEVEEADTEAWMDFIDGDDWQQPSRTTRSPTGTLFNGSTASKRESDSASSNESSADDSTSPSEEVQVPKKQSRNRQILKSDSSSPSSVEALPKAKIHTVSRPRPRPSVGQSKPGGAAKKSLIDLFTPSPEADQMILDLPAENFVAEDSSSEDESPPPIQRRRMRVARQRAKSISSDDSKKPLQQHQQLNLKSQEWPLEPKEEAKFEIEIPKKVPSCELHQTFGDDALLCCSSTLPGMLDVDAWSISVKPKTLLKFFGVPHSMVHLVGHAPKGNRDHAIYQDWVYLGENGSYLLIEPELKMPFILALQQYRVVQGATYPSVITYGSPVISMLTFVQCLEEIKCNTVRVQSYGMKLDLPNGPLNWNMSIPRHSLQKTNRWDIGLQYNTGGITLFKRVNQGTGKFRMDHFPMLTPIGDDYGSYRWIVKTKHGDYHMKAYSRVVHAIKSWHSKMGLYKSTIMRALRSKRETVKKMLFHLRRTLPAHMTGYRLEVTIECEDLEGARKFAIKSGFLDIKTWLNPPSEELEPFKLKMKEVSLKDFFANAQWLMEKAEERKFFVGRDAGQVTLLQQQVAKDLLSSIGWNSDPARKPTPAKLESAWWRQISQPQSEAQVMDLVIQFKRHDPKILFEVIRKELPCPKNIKHRFNKMGGPKRFRAICKDKNCKVIQNAEGAREWWARNILDGTLQRDIFDSFGIYVPPRTVEAQESPDLEIEFRPQGRQDLEELKLRQLPFKPNADDIMALPVWPTVRVTKSSVRGDGNCLFIALSKAMGEAGLPPKVMRKTLVQECMTDAFKAKYTPYLEGGDWEAWERKMLRNGQWADEFCLYAFRRKYKIPLAILNLNPARARIPAKGKKPAVEAKPDEWWWHKVHEGDDGPWLGLYLRHSHYELLVSEE